MILFITAASFYIKKNKLRRKGEVNWKKRMLCFLLTVLLALPSFSAGVTIQASGESRTDIYKSSVPGTGLYWIDRNGTTGGTDGWFSFYETSDGSIAYCLSHKKGHPDGQIYARAGMDGFVTHFGQQEAAAVTRILEAGYPLGKDYWACAGMGLTEMDMRAATQLAIWHVQALLGTDEDTGPAMGSALQYSNLYTGRDVAGMVDQLVDYGLHGGISPVIRNIRVTAGTTSISGTVMTSTFTIQNEGYGQWTGRFSGLPAGASAAVNGAGVSLADNRFTGTAAGTITVSVSYPAVYGKKVSLTVRGRVLEKSANLFYYTPADKSAQEIVLMTQNGYADEGQSTAALSTPGQQGGMIRLAKQDEKGNAISGSGIYGVYSDAACQQEVAQIAVADGFGTSKVLSFGTYYVKEIQAPFGYGLSDTVYPVTLSADESGTQYVTAGQNVTDIPQQIQVIIQKIDEKGQAIISDSASFGIYRADDDSLAAEVITGKDGTGTVQIPLGSYYIQELIPPAGYVLASEKSQTFTFTGDESGRAVIPFTYQAENEKQVGRLLVQKTDGEGRLITSGSAVIGVYRDKDCKNRVDTLVTSGGEAYSKELEPGTYYLKELIAPSGYRLSETIGEVTIAPDKTGQAVIVSQYTMTDEAQKGQIIVIKQDAVTGQVITASHAVYDIYDSLTNTRVGTISTDQNGRGTSEPLPLGTYYLKEVKAPFGYALNDLISEPFQIEGDGTGKDLVTYISYQGDNPQTATIEIRKTDSSGNLITSDNAVFELYDEKDRLVATLDTGKSGMAVSEKLPLGQYYAVETKAPFSYEINEEPIFFSCMGDDTGRETVAYSQSAVNEKQKAMLVIRKTDSSGNLITSDNAVFEVYDEKRQLVGKIDTGSTGIGVLGGLPLGNYRAVEVKPPKGYVGLTEEICFYCTGDSSGKPVAVYSREVVNQRQKAQISIVKIDENTGEKITVSNAVFGIYEAETGKKAGTIDTGNDGTGISTELPLGRYWLKEEKAPKGYVLAQKPLEAVCTGDESGQAVVAYSYSIENEKQQIAIVIEKVDKETGDAITTPAVFEIYRIETEKNAVFAAGQGNAEENSARTLVATLTTGETGKAVSGPMPVNAWYEIVEKQAPEGYVLKKEPVLVYGAGDESGEAIVDYESLIENKKIRGDIVLTKYDRDYPETKLSGAEFVIYEDTDKDGKYDSEKDRELGKFTEEEEGFYAVRNMAYGRYFIKETAAPAGFRLDGGIYEVWIEQEGKIYKIENETGKGFYNEAMKGTIRIIKTCQDGKTEGISFLVKGTDMTGRVYEEVFQTDENGVLLIEGLRIGDYNISEVQNEKTASYVLPAGQQISIQDGDTVTAHFYNALKEIPQTGDAGYWIGPLILGIVCLASGIILFVKQRKE